MNKWLFIALAASLAPASYAQMLNGVHRRDDYTEFKLKSVKTESQVIGPLVRNKTIYTFDNPYKELVEAVFDFETNRGAALDGFAYWYKTERVPGVLMDKAMAWFIYTAITSRDRDPGVMDMVSPNQFHAQIYPLAVGFDLRLELTTVDFLSPQIDRFVVPRPGVYHSGDVPQSWNVTGYRAPLADANTKNGRVVAVQLPMLNMLDVQSVAQAGPEGRMFVAGIVRGGINASQPKIGGLRDVHVMQRADSTDSKDAFLFVGWTKSLTGLSVNQNGQVEGFKPRVLPLGSICSKLWAANHLAEGDWYNGKGVLAFSLKYQVPSNQTALLAVPKSEMKLFSKKRTEYLRKLARQRREGKRRGRGRRQDLNWNQNRGGDPELRIEALDAQSVFARLPDGRVLQLRPLTDGLWGRNFEVPTDAPEGAYQVKVTVVRKDGTLREQVVTYTVDRTPPQGTAELVVEQGKLVLRVHAKADLNEVAAYLADGRKIVLKEVSPGLYEVVLSEDAAAFAGLVVVVLKDAASNKTELQCTWPSH